MAKMPRYYQEEAIKAIDDYFSDGSTNPIVVLATGTGKSLVIAEYIKRALEYDPTVRAVCAVDTKELVQQNYEEFLNQMPFGPAGIYSSGLNRQEAKAQILFCGIQSVFDKANKIGRTDILMIDECHGVSFEGVRWHQFLTDLRKINPYMIIIGFTATPYRMDSGYLWTGKDRLFNGVCYDYTVKQGMADGYLSNIISKGMKTKFDVTGVAKTKGDFVEKQLQEAVNKQEITEAAVEEIIECGQDRRAWLVFGAGVDHCENILKIMQDRGVSARVVLGSTPDKERDEAIQDFKDGKVKCLINNAVLTKGFNVPFVDLIAAMRPTASAVLWCQMVGRGFRIADGKENCLLLDFSQNIQRFGFIDEIEFKDKKEKNSDLLDVPPMKECEKCQTICHAAIKFCPVCSHEFPFDKNPKHEARSYDGAVLSTQSEPETYKVTDVAWHAHTRKTPYSLKVTYYCGVNRFSEWICLEHTGFAKTKAIQWWKSRIDPWRIEGREEALEWLEMPNGIPVSIDEALKWKHIMKMPAAILVKKEGKYDRIVGYSEEEFLSVSQSLPRQNQREQDEFDALFG